MSVYDALWSVEDHVEGVLRAEGPLTQPQLAARVFAVPVHPTGNLEVDRERRTALRNVQAAIQALRRRDVPVIDSPDGMRIAATAEEAEAEFQRLRSRIRSQSVTAWGLRRAARRMRDAKVEQQTLWEAA